MKFSLIPKEEKFFEMFEMASSNVKKGLHALHSLVIHYDELQEHSALVKLREHEGDDITHDIIMKLNQTFVTPFDRDDIHELACSLDDIIDLAWGVADRFVLYKINKPTPEMIEIVEILGRSGGELHKAICKMSHFQYDNILEHCKAVDSLENQVDQIVRHAVAALMNSQEAPVEIMKLKEIYDHLERAADRCADVANVIESVSLKNA